MIVFFVKHIWIFYFPYIALMNESNISLGRLAWQRLKKNRIAFTGLCIILFFCFVAIFSYVIAPDDAPFADTQTVEIQASNPGYEQQFLKLPLASVPTSSNFISRIFLGEKKSYSLLPITSFTIEQDSIAVTKFIDEDTAVLQKYSKQIFTKEQLERTENLIVSKTYWLGTDVFGRDMLSRMIIGTRVSLAVGLIAVLVSLSLGIFLGAMAGFYGGKRDAVIMWLINVTWSIPTLLLVFAITLAMGKGFWQIFIAIGLTLWVSVARLVRGQVMAAKNLEYVQAARALGYGDFRIVSKHILPNIIGPLLVLAASNFATAIIIEAGLSFLGIGVQPPMPSWGLMIKENYNFIITHRPLLALIPGIAIMLLVLAFNLLGNGLRDAVDVKSI